MSRETKENIIYGVCVVVILLSLGAIYFMSAAYMETVSLTEVLK